MDPISLGLMTAAAGKVVEALLGEKANKLVATIVGGVIGNRADGLVCGAARSSWNYFQNLRTEDPLLNHDLERASREAYLVATLELLRQAELRTQMTSSGSPMMRAGEPDTLRTLRRAVETDLRDTANTLPEALEDVHLFLVDPKFAPADRAQRLRETLRRNLDRDLERWVRVASMPPAILELLDHGWTLDTPFRQAVPRDWYSLIAIAFMEKLKTEPRVAAVFEAKLLSGIAAREPAAKTVETFSGFTGEFEQITVPLQRIEAALDVVRRDVGQIKEQVRETGEDVREIKDWLRWVRGVPGWAWVLSLGAIAAGAAGFATETGARVACAAPGVRSLCGSLGIGGAPSAAEEAVWARRSAGDCGTLRTYLARFPAGAYAEEATRRLAGAIREETERWVAEEKVHDFAVRSALEPAPSEAAAKARALERAEREAAATCGSYAQGEYRLKGPPRAQVREWRCLKREGGFHCGFDGAVTCAVEGRRVDAVERCP